MTAKDYKDCVLSSNISNSAASDINFLFLNPKIIALDHKKVNISKCFLVQSKKLCKQMFLLYLLHNFLN